MQKNVAGQKWIVFAFDRTDNTAKTGDANNITANLRIDGAGADAVDDTNPAELEDGFYVFDITQAESNGDYILITPASSTGDIQVIGCPAALWTVPPNFNALGIASGRVDMGKCGGNAVAAGAIPNAAANAAGGLPISAGGGLALDTKLANTNEVTVARMGALTDLINGGRLDLLIDAILLDTGTTLENRQVTIATDAARLTAVRAAILTDWINGGRLDLLLDAIPTTVMRGTDGANTTVPDAAGIAPTKEEIRTEVDTNSTRLDANMSSRAAPGAEMNLVNAAITAAKIAAAAFTSAKYDGSTAFPVSEKQSKAASTMILGTVSWNNTNATTTVIYCDNITEATADHYNGRIMIFLTGALVGQATDITDYELVAGEGKFTVTALTEAPADNDTFIIV